MRDEIINTWDQNMRAGGDRIAILYSAQDLSRGGRCAKWSIAHFKDGKSYATDQNAAWYDGKMKTFIPFEPPRATFHEKKKLALDKAIAWVTEKYGKREFVRNRMGDMVERDVNEQFPLRKRQRVKRVVMKEGS